MEALILPEGIHGRRRIFPAASQPPKRRNVLVADVELLQRLRQHVAVVLWVRMRTGDGTDIRNERGFNATEQIDEFVYRPRAVTDCIEWVRHRLIISLFSAYGNRPDRYSLLSPSLSAN